MRRIYIGGNLFWVYLRDLNKVVPFVWSKDRTKVKNIENGDVIDYAKDDRFLHDIIKIKYHQKSPVQIIEFPKVLSMLGLNEKEIYFGANKYTNLNNALYSKRQVVNATKKIQEIVIKREKLEDLQK